MPKTKAAPPAAPVPADYFDAFEAGVEAARNMPADYIDSMRTAYRRELDRTFPRAASDLGWVSAAPMPKTAAAPVPKTEAAPSASL